MNELMIFKNENFGEIRTVEIDGNIWFVGKDVATALGYKDVADALKKHVNEDDKLKVKVGEIPTLKTSNYGVYLINESGVYALIFGSKLESAKGFKHWVTSEVLPSIRKTGSYTVQKSVQKSDRELDLLEEQLRIEKSNAFKLLGESYDGKSKTFKEVCSTYAFNTLAGKNVMELPASQKTYSAEDIGKELGISATKVGRIANHYNLKTDEYGCWNKDKAKYDSSKEVDAFRYYENAISEIAKHKDEVIPREKKIIENQTDSDLFSA